MCRLTPQEDTVRPCKDALAKRPYPLKPGDVVSAYYLWHGCVESRAGATREWIAALQVYLAQLEAQKVGALMPEHMLRRSGVGLRKKIHGPSPRKS
jgi:hypothetical protein